MYENHLVVGDFNRKKVLILGEFPIDPEPYNERNLIVVKVTLENAFQELNYSKAIIVSDYPSRFALITNFYNQLYSNAVNLGLKVVVLAHSDATFNQIVAIPRTTAVPPYHVLNLRALPEVIARHSPGPPAENVEIIMEDASDLDPETILLLKRSFFGCEKIYLKSIGGGKASDNLFKVHAWISDSRVGPLPSPFFAKIGNLEAIRTEKNKYLNYTDLYIPFRYRPNCRIERCVEGEKKASLVGNFVDEAIPLRKALQEAHSSGIIFSLFEKSLRGFRIQHVVSGKPPTTGGLKNFIEGRVKINKLSARTDVIKHAQRLGLRGDIQTLYDRLLSICPEKCLEGLYHGDLNSRNIMVKGDDAILIDFSSIRNDGPLTADPATIEISLCFELDEYKFSDSSKWKEYFTKWKTFIDVAYDPATLTKPLALTEIIPDKFTWLRRAIRETRHILIGCDCNHNEIKAVLASYLLRIARIAPEKLDNPKDIAEFDLRAYALVVAEKIITSFK